MTNTIKWVIIKPSMAQGGKASLEYPDASFDHLEGNIHNAVRWFLEDMSPSDIYGMVRTEDGKGVIIYYREARYE